MSNLESAKRSRVERNGVHAWHPYYAGYSEAFVESAIRYLGLTHKDVILDPWGGSGTTAIIADRNGATCISNDINPVMSIFAAAKSQIVLLYEKEIVNFFDGIRDLHFLNEKAFSRPLGRLSELYDEHTSTFLSYVVATLPFPEWIDRHTESLTDIRNVVGTERSRNYPYAFCLAVIFVTLRRQTGMQSGANPTWLKSKNSPSSLDTCDLAAKFRQTADEMLNDLKSFYKNAIKGAGRTVSLQSDFRASLIEPSSIDAIITSPPYLTRIDYAMSTAPELAFFGDFTFLTDLRHQTMGAPVITKNQRSQSEMWGSRTNRILEDIKNHATKAASTYYWKNIVQYFMDAHSSIKQCYRVMKQDGSGLIVVQSSYFKDIEIPLGDLYVDILSLSGFDAKIAHREHVRGHLAHVNTKSSLYVKNKTYYEDVVYFKKLK